MFGLEITQVGVTDELAKQILTTAVSAGHTHGIGYWADVHEAPTDTRGRVLSLRLTEREAYDVNTPKRTRLLHPADMAPAIRQMLNHDRNKWAARLFNDDGLDGPLADAIVQFACFGDVIYG